MLSNLTGQKYHYLVPFNEMRDKNNERNRRKCMPSRHYTCREATTGCDNTEIRKVKR